MLNIIACNSCINWVSIEGYWNIVYTNNVSTQFTLESSVETSQENIDITYKRSIFDNLIQTAQQSGITFLLKQLNPTSSVSSINPTILPFDKIQIIGINVAQKTTISQSWQNDKQEIMNVFQWTLKGQYINNGTSIQNIQAMGQASLVLPQGIYPKCSIESCSDKTCQICKVPQLVQRNCSFVYYTNQGYNLNYIAQASQLQNYNYHCEMSQLIKDCFNDFSKRTECGCIQINEGECPQKYPYLIDKQFLNDTTYTIYCKENTLSLQNNTCYFDSECRGYSKDTQKNYSNKCLFNQIKCLDVVDQKLSCQDYYDYNYQKYNINIKLSYQICCQSNIFLGNTPCSTSNSQNAVKSGKSGKINFFYITLLFFLVQI
ncbi:hypothetical protein ABPG74_008574 [Tetrahymena malaccensis]